MNAVDTNVLIYALDVDEPVKQARAQGLLDQLAAAGGGTVMVWQAAGEFLSNLRKREAAGRITASLVESHFRKVLNMFPLTPPSLQVFPRYFDLHARYSLSHWDAMLLAACKKPASPRSTPRTCRPARTTTASLS